MAKIAFRDKLRFEKLLGMKTGYVSNLSNHEFFQLVQDVTQININSPTYEVLGTSKANRLRAFWDRESDVIVGTLLLDLVEHVRNLNVDLMAPHQPLLEECKRIAEQMKATPPLLDSDILSTMPEEMDLERLGSTILGAIKNDEPETAIDRLHTYTVRYLRSICAKRSIVTGQEMPVHSLLGAYLKDLKAANTPMTMMSERILKSCISTLDAYNDVRNNWSLAHDNPVLSYDESLLILNHVTSAIKYIQSIETKSTKLKAKVTD